MRCRRPSICPASYRRAKASASTKILHNPPRTTTRPFSQHSRSGNLLQNDQSNRPFPRKFSILKTAPRTPSQNFKLHASRIPRRPQRALQPPSHRGVETSDRKPRPNWSPEMLLSLYRDVCRLLLSHQPRLLLCVLRMSNPSLRAIFG
jgi:hypothetical protein